MQHVIGRYALAHVAGGAVKWTAVFNGLDIAEIRRLEDDTESVQPLAKQAALSSESNINSLFFRYSPR